MTISLLVTAAVAAVLLYALIVRFTTPRFDPLRETNPAQLEGDWIQVELLNGSGVDNLAAEARTYMRGRGFDVVGVGNHATDDVRTSFVVDHVGDRAAARKVALALGIDPETIVEEISADAVFDASVVIGRDYAELAPFRHAEN